MDEFFVWVCYYFIYLKVNLEFMDSVKFIVLSLDFFL